LVCLRAVTSILAMQLDRVGERFGVFGMPQDKFLELLSRRRDHDLLIQVFARYAGCLISARVLEDPNIEYRKAQDIPLYPDSPNGMGGDQVD
jgi:hypothetical protein